MLTSKAKCYTCLCINQKGLFSSDDGMYVMYLYIFRFWFLCIKKLRILINLRLLKYNLHSTHLTLKKISLLFVSLKLLVRPLVHRQEGHQGLLHSALLPPRLEVSSLAHQTVPQDLEASSLEAHR